MGEASVCLVKMGDYFAFVTDEYGHRRQNIFNANVREYEGDIDVNAAIRRTLETGVASPNFWWLNNGITIVASKAPLNMSTFTLEDPKVVNGLQTSHEIYSYYTAHSPAADERLILIRIIVTDDENMRNQILQATNNQTRIPSYALRGTEEIHRDIEQFFKENGLFYDRQKNYYKLLGEPKGQIISLLYVVQAVVSIALNRSNDARGRPTVFIRDDTEYKKVFDEQYHFRVYLHCAQLQQKVDEWLRTVAPKYMRLEKTNLRFGLSYFVAAMKLKSSKPSHQAISENLDVNSISAKFIHKCAKHVWSIYKSLRHQRRLSGDRIAKNIEFDEKMAQQVNCLLTGTTTDTGQLELNMLDETWDS